MLANLDNEVIFKKAFTDRIVFHAFVKDVLGIDVEVDEIETEKQFRPSIGSIDFKLDIFAESKKDRVVIEIQRIEYDSNFDRFLHYFMMSIAELQSNYKEYNIDKTVYAIVVMTAPYTIKDKSNRPVLNEVLISKLNPHDLKNREIPLYNHQLVFLNAYHREDSTPQPIRDWLDLIYQSIHEYENPKINLNNPAIKRAAEIIDVDNLTPTERADRKRLESTKVTLQIREQNARNKGREEERELQKQKTIEAIVNAHESGIDIPTIAQIFNKTPEAIEKIINENP